MTTGRINQVAIFSPSIRFPIIWKYYFSSIRKEHVLLFHMKKKNI